MDNLLFVSPKVVAIGQNVLPFQSNGSILTFNGKAIGSKLIAQEFKSPKFFHSRPSSDSASGKIHISQLTMLFHKFQILVTLLEYIKIP